MRLTHPREGVVTLIATRAEISALVAAARMALEAIRHDPAAPATAAALLSRVIGEYDAAVARAARRD